MAAELGLRRDNRGMTRNFRALAATFAIAACCVAGCKVQGSGTAAGTATAGAASAGSQARAGALLQVHDPGKVTGTVPASCHVLSGPRPDPACTPGAIDPAVTQANIGSTICASGYTAKVRPSSSATNKLKAKMYVAYSIPNGTVSELDHDVPLELGGANDVANLWPEVGKLPNPKDKVENDLHKAVCSGKVQVAAAQQAIAANWMTAESALGLS
jgi:hypothetical protein